MKILIPGAGATGLSVAAKFSNICTVHAVCRSVSSKAIRQRGRTTGIGFPNSAVVEKGRAHVIPTPYNAFIVNLIRFCKSLEERREQP
jgi:ketopantoate reductase